MQDKLYKKIQTNITPFAFDKETVAVFDDMINRSIPGYKTYIDLLQYFSIYIKNDSRIYDLGCSLGYALFSLLQNNQKDLEKIIAIDKSHDMIQKMQSNRLVKEYKIKCYQDDIIKVRVKNTSVVMLNFVLQFIKPCDKNKILANIYNGLNKDGILIIAEKVIYHNKQTQKTLQNLHFEFKKNSGYSPLEIKQKEQALEQILYIESIKKLKERLQIAGFDMIHLFFAAFNFVAFFVEKK
jgi:tRNA (cmo5U34)-methyltransferase